MTLFILRIDKIRLPLEIFCVERHDAILVFERADCYGNFVFKFTINSKIFFRVYFLTDKNIVVHLIYKIITKKMI